MIIIDSAGLSEIGKKRRDNEDRMLVNDTLQLYAVADGMGGHQAGEVASQMALDTLQTYFQNPGKSDPQVSRASGRRLSEKANDLLRGIRLSNCKVHEASRANSAHRGMGTTVAAVCFTDDTIIAANVGDSTIHLIRNDEITLLSVTHTLLAEQAAIDEEFAERLGGELGHVLTRAIGTRAEVKIDVSEMECFPEDIFVISSDGLTNKATPAEIKAIVNSEAPRKACRRLIDLANDRGGDDNITAVVAKVKRVTPGKRRFAGKWRILFDRLKRIR